MVRRQLWFQHDGTPAHFCIDARAQLTVDFSELWIGIPGHVAWTPRSPDLTTLDFYLCGHVKGMVYETSVTS